MNELPYIDPQPVRQQPGLVLGFTRAERASIRERGAAADYAGRVRRRRARGRFSNHWERVRA